MKVGFCLRELGEGRQHRALLWRQDMQILPSLCWLNLPVAIHAPISYFHLSHHEMMEAIPRFTAAAAKSLQSCPTLWDPIDGSPPQAPPSLGFSRQEHWSGFAISFSNAWKWKVKVKTLSCVWLLATPWTAAHQAPPSMGFSRQESWSGVPLLSLTRIQSSSLNNSSPTEVQLCS